MANHHYTASELLAINPSDLIHPEILSEGATPSYALGVAFADCCGAVDGWPMMVIDLNGPGADKLLRRFYKIQY